MAQHKIGGRAYEATSLEDAINQHLAFLNPVADEPAIDAVPMPDVNVKTNNGGGIYVSGRGAGSLNISDRELASFMVGAQEVANRIAAHIVDTGAAGIGRAHKGETERSVTARRAFVLNVARRIVQELADADAATNTATVPADDATTEGDAAIV